MSRQKLPQVLKIQPENELLFKGSFQDVITSHLILTNPSEKRVCFKVKTTAPRRYCVRPNSGFIKPGGQVDVSVMLQPLDSETQDKAKHKFMVQSMFAPNDAEDVEQLWSEASSAELMDSKLRCVFEIEDVEEPKEEVGAPEPHLPAMTSAPDAEPPAELLSSTTGGGGDLREGGQNELKTLMEECKRLQAENASLKQKQRELAQKEIHGKESTQATMNDDVSRQVVYFAIAAFLVGVFMGYLLL